MRNFIYFYFIVFYTLYTPFCISNAEKVSQSSLKTPSKVGVSNEK